MGWTMAAILRMDTPNTARKGRRGRRANTGENLNILKSRQKLMASQKSQRSPSEGTETRYMMVTQMITVIKGIKIEAEDKEGAKDIQGIPEEEDSGTVGFAIGLSRSRKSNR